MKLTGCRLTIINKSELILQPPTSNSFLNVGAWVFTVAKIVQNKEMVIKRFTGSGSCLYILQWKHLSAFSMAGSRGLDH
jgi:Na+-translocating ferredoxin:NAD+ oxidoreductase RnfA subunit